jgi:molybdopterin converting factor small subunit
MGIVILKIPPWAASVWNVKSSRHLLLKQEINDDITLRDLLSELVSTNQDLFSKIYDIKAKRISDQVLITINNSLLQFKDKEEYKLVDGDIVTLLPVFSDG